MWTWRKGCQPAAREDRPPGHSAEPVHGHGRTKVRACSCPTSFYLDRRKLIADPQSGLTHWRDKLFIAMADSAIDPTEYFHLPPNRVVELERKSLSKVRTPRERHHWASANRTGRPTAALLFSLPRALPFLAPLTFRQIHAKHTVACRVERDRRRKPEWTRSTSPAS